MMRELVRSTRFKHDFKRIVRRGYDISLLDEVIESLATDKPLAAKHKPHALTGDYDGAMECHITPDWLLVYNIESPAYLGLIATGTHSDIF